MNKELKALFESELLNEDTKKALTEAIAGVKAEAIEEATKSLEVDFAKKFSAEKEKLNEGITALVAEQVSKEFVELQEDVKKYQNVEVEYAKKLEDFKAEYKQKLEESLTALVDQVVKAEFDELKEDLVESKKSHFGKKIFETFKSEFEQFGITEDMKALQAKLTSDLEASQKALEESQKVVADMNRTKVMEGLLSNLKGSKREVMKTVLENVATDKLEARYNEVIDSVLEEKKEVVTEEKEEGTQTVVVNESAKDEKYDLWKKIIKG